MANGTWNDYLLLLGKVTKALEQLTEVEKTKTNAVTAGDLAAVEQCMKQEQVMSLSLRGIEQKRTALADRLGLRGVPLRELAAHSPEGLALGDLLDNAIGDILIKAGNQISVVVGVDGAALDLLGGVGHGQGQAPLQQTAKQQVQVGAVGLDVAHQLVEHTLVVLPGGIVHVSHVSVVQLEHPETAVKGLSGVICSDFLGSAADALFANLADIFVSRVVCFAFFTAYLGQLYHDKAAAAAVFCVELHDGMGGGGTAAEKVEDNVIKIKINQSQ